MTRYKSAAAMSAAVTANAKAQASSPTEAVQLRQRWLRSRLCERVMHSDRWVLKGGTAMLVRVESARATRDVDFGVTGDINEVLTELRALIAVDTGDHLRFDVTRGPTVQTRRVGVIVALTVTPYFGVQQQPPFTIDIALRPEPPLVPDVLVPDPVILIDGLTHRPWRIYPLECHAADKLAAIIETHEGQPSSRYRDLVDLVVIADTQHLGYARLQLAVSTELARRGLAVPATFGVPDQGGWRAGYRSERTNTPAQHHDFDGAMALVGELFNPVFTVALAAGSSWTPPHGWS